MSFIFGDNLGVMLDCASLPGARLRGGASNGFESERLTPGPAAQACWSCLPLNVRKTVHDTCIHHLPWIASDVSAWSEYCQWTHHKEWLRRARLAERLTHTPGGKHGRWSVMRRSPRGFWRPHAISEVFIEDIFEQTADGVRDGGRRIPVAIISSGPCSVLVVQLGQHAGYRVRWPIDAASSKERRFVQDWIAGQLAIPAAAATLYDVV